MIHALTHWGRVTHICVGNLTIIDPDNGLSPGRRQAIIWTNAGLLLIGPLGTNFNEILTHWGRDKMDAISQTTFSNPFSSMKMHELRLRFHWSLFATSHYLNQWWLVCWRIYASLGLNELIEILTFSFKKMRLKVSSAKRRPFCLSLNLLNRLWLWNILSVYFSLYHSIQMNLSRHMSVKILLCRRVKLSDTEKC